jgi:hypothetical protein
MSILRVANVQFNASGTRRIDYDATNDDGIIKISADAIKLPVGDTASRPNSQAGMIRYNSDLGLFEGANSTAWGSIGGVVDFATANGWANSVGVSANSYADATGIAGNNYTNYVGASANSYATAMDTAGNNYTNAVGLAGNNYVNAVVFPAANTKLANATGTLAGSLSTTGTVTSNGYVYVTASDAGNEGGEIQLSGAGSYAGWALDAYQNNHRTFVRTGSTLANVTYFHALGGSVRMGINKADPLYTLDVNGELNTGSRGITKASMPAGSILQVVQTVKSDTFVSSSASWVDVTGMSVDITPTLATSKILVSFAIHGTTVNVAYVKLLRNGSDIAIGDASSNRIRCTAGNFNVGGDGNTTYLFTHEFLDSPGTTSTLTYKLQFRHESGGSNWHVNRTVNDPDSSTGMRGISTITVKEIAV